MPEILQKYSNLEQNVQVFALRQKDSSSPLLYGSKTNIGASITVCSSSNQDYSSQLGVHTTS